MARLETNGYYALGVPFYLALMGAEIAYNRYKGQKVYPFAGTVGNLSTSLGEVVLGLFLGPHLIALYDWGYEHLALIRWPEGSIAPWVLAFIVSDLCYYWYHRAGHRVGALWAIHGVHHQSEQFDLSLAMRHPWLSDLYSFPFYVPLPLLGIRPEQFFVAISAISFYALTVHTNMFSRPTFFAFVSPGTHVVHHSRNPRYLGKNLGAMLTVWDRLFGTHVEVDPADPPVLGTRSGYETHDGARAQWIFFRDLVRMSRRGRTLRERLLPFFARPGSRPAGAAPLEPMPRARSEESIPAITRAYVAFQFAATASFAMYVLWLRDAHPLSLQIVSAAAILWSLSTIGGLLDGRPGCASRELVRLTAFALIAVWLLQTPRYATVGACLMTAACAGAAWLLAGYRSFARSTA